MDHSSENGRTEQMYQRDIADSILGQVLSSQMEGAKHWIADTVETVSEALGGISAEPWDWLWVPKRAVWKKPE